MGAADPITFTLGTSEERAFRIFANGARITDLSGITRWTAALAGALVDSDANPECFDWTSTGAVDADGVEVLVLLFGTLDLTLGATSLALTYYDADHPSGRQLDTVFPAIVQGAASGSPPATIGTVSSSDVALVGVPGKVLTDLFDGGYDLTIKTLDIITRGPWIDLRAYGAVGNGIADDGPAVAAAVSAAVTAGKCLFVPVGTYLCTTWSAFNPTTTLRIRGDGPTSILKGTGSVKFASPQGDVDVQDMTFSTWKGVFDTNTTAGGSVGELNLDRVRFEDMTAPQNGVVSLEIPVSRARITNCVWDTIIGYALRIGEDDDALEDTWRDIVVIGNSLSGITNNNGNAAAMVLYGREISATDNWINGVTVTGTGEAWGIYTKARFSSVEGNKVLGISAASDATYPINCKGTNRGELTHTSPYGYSLAVIGNSVVLPENTGYGIRIASDDMTVTGNTVDGGANGILAESDGPVGSTIVGNTLRSAGTCTTAINLISKGDNVTVTGNTITGWINGIAVSNGSTAIRNYSITGNTIDSRDSAGSAIANSYGILLNGSALLTNCNISENVISHAAYGIYAKYAHKTRIVGNQMATIANPSLSVRSGGNNKDILVSQDYKLQTTDDAATVIAQWDLTGVACTLRLRATIIGELSDHSQQALYTIEALAKFDGSTTVTQIGSTAALVTVESDSAWVGPTLVTATNKLYLKVAGKAASTIDWRARVEWEQITAGSDV